MIRIVHRGWQGHFCMQCMFHLNTLIDDGEIAIVVSTVGRCPDPIKPRDENGDIIFYEIGWRRHFETMAFHALDDKFRDADVTRGVCFQSPWDWDSPELEIEANDGHFAVVDEIVSRMESGDKFEEKP